MENQVKSFQEIDGHMYENLVMVKYCTPGSVSAVCSHLRSGDELLSINGTCVLPLNQNQIRNLLRIDNIRIVFLSWPGCLV